MGVVKYNTLSIIFSLTGLVSILLISVAGSPQYGIFSRTWHLVGGIEVLLLVGTLFLALGAIVLRLSPAKNAEHRVVPLIVLLVSLMPLGLFCLVLILRYMAG